MAAVCGSCGIALTADELIFYGRSCEACERASMRASRAETAATADQRTPHGTGADVASLVTADIEARAALGRERYGERLRAHNGRDALVDAYQEALDLAMYLRQAIEERGDNADG